LLNSISSCVRDIALKAYWGHKFDLSGSRDVIDHVTIWLCYFLLAVLWNQVSISIECHAMIHTTLIRPLNKGQGHSFWYQSISHIRLPIGCQ